MVIPVLLRKLLRDLFSRKGALLALVVIMMVGVGSFTGMASVFRDLDDARARYYREYRLADFWVDVKRAPAWAVESLDTVPNVQEAEGRVNVSALLDLPGKEVPISGTAISLPLPRRPILNDVLLRSGTWFSSDDARETILNEAFASANGIHPGDRLKVLLLDKQHDLLVVGTAMSPEFVYLFPPDGGFAPDPERFGLIYLPERFLQESAGMDGAYNQVVGLTHDDSRQAIENTLTLIEDRLDRFGVANTTSIYEQTSASLLRDELVGLKVTSTSLPILFLGVAALILNVLLGRLVLQQRTVIGTLRALGYSSMRLTVHYLGYGITAGLVGGIAGILFGLWIQGIYLGLYRQFYEIPKLELHFYPGILLLAISLSLLFSIAGTIKGVRSAVLLNPAAAMRPPPPEKGGRVLPERIPFLWKRLPFRSKMMLRAVFRNPFRSGVSFLATTISTGLVLTSLSFIDAFDMMIGFQFERISRQDITINLREPSHYEAVDEVDGLAGISNAEGELALVCDMKNGPNSKRTAVIGLSPDARLHTPLDAEGNAVRIPDEGLCLTSKLAEILNVKPGETIRLRPLIGRREEVEAPVVSTVKTFLGLEAFANRDYLARLIGEDNSVNTILAMQSKGRSDKPFITELKKRPAVVGIGERARILGQFDKTLGETLGGMIASMVFFSGLIAFGAILNAALVSLNERQREVGTLRVIGYSTSQVSSIFAGESFFVATFGIIAGLFAGVGLSHLLGLAYNTELYRFPIVLLPIRFFQAALIMAVFVGVAQLFVMRLIARLDWRSVLQVKE